MSGSALQVLDAETARTVGRVCDAIVPGSARVRPEVYVDALLARMDEGTRGAAIAAFQKSPRGRSRDHVATQEFAWARALAIEAFYSDFVAPGVEARGRMGGDRLLDPARDPAEEGLVVPRDLRMSRERFDVVVVGSGAGGGVVAGELADRGRSVLLLEAGPHRTAADFTRWEAKANHDFWWPLRFAPIDGGAGGVVALLAARCVGGTTTINTKVALRVADHDYAKWHEASGLSGPTDRRSARAISTRTTIASRSASASACDPTGARACTRSSPASGRSGRISSPCTPTPMRTA